MPVGEDAALLSSSRVAVAQTELQPFRHSAGHSVILRPYGKPVIVVSLYFLELSQGAALGLVDNLAIDALTASVIAERNFTYPALAVIVVIAPPTRGVALPTAENTVRDVRVSRHAPRSDEKGSLLWLTGVIEPGLLR